MLLIKRSICAGKVFSEAMLPVSELEYTGIMEKLAILDKKFKVRAAELAPVMA